MGSITDNIPVVGGIAQAGTGLAQSIYGMFSLGSDKAERQRIQRALDKTIKNRPVYKDPTQIDDILNLRKKEMNYDTKLPGLDKAKDDIGAQTSQSVGNIKEMSNSVAGSLGAVSNVYKSQTSLLADLDVKGSMYSAAKKQSTEDAYAQALQLKGDYADKAWNWNTGQKYQEDYNRLSGQITQQSQQEQADRNMIMQGFGNVGSGLMKAATTP